MPACNKLPNYLKADLFINMDRSGIGRLRIYQDPFHMWEMID